MLADLNAIPKWVVISLAVTYVIMAASLLKTLLGIGGNSAKPKRGITPGLRAKLIKFSRETRENDIIEMGVNYKKMLNSLGKKEFHSMKFEGTAGETKMSFEPSRGSPKMEEILMKSGIRPFGNILSLCAGSGGWEYILARYESVVGILSVTLGKTGGRQGHQTFTPHAFPGRDKVQVIYGDVTKMPSDMSEDFDCIIFDGGESDANYTRETKRAAELLEAGFTRFVRPGHMFIAKILTPAVHDVIRQLKHIRTITGSGNLVLLNNSLNSNQELYFVSGRPNGRIAMQIHSAQRERLNRIIVNEEHAREYVEPLNWKGPDYSESVRQLGKPILGAVRKKFKQWVDGGVFYFGSRGSTGTNRVAPVWHLLRSVQAYIPKLADWQATNTTTAGFEKIFAAKIDTTPVEKSIYYEIMSRVFHHMATFYIENGVRGRTLSYDEICAQANHAGARTVIDVEWQNVGEFLRHPQYEKYMREYEEAMLRGKPLGAIFWAAGKKEKKKHGGNYGSRMFAYMGIVMRMQELKYLGGLMDFVKPNVNACCVGGLGLHDFGMRVRDNFREAAVCLDIAGWDTKISKRVLEMEERFMIEVGFSREHVQALYAIYKNPAILIPDNTTGFVRSRLLYGNGQRMSGAQTTYSGNTLTVIALTITAWIVANNIAIEDERETVHSILSGRGKISVLSSGDDHFVSGDVESVRRYSRAWHVYNDMGFIRKDLGLTNDTPVRFSIEEVEFCSHSYERVTYYDENNDRVAERWMPSRQYTEIFGRASIWIAGTDGISEVGAWVAAQAVNLMLNYHHLRDARRLAMAMRAIVPRNLTFSGREIKFLPRPWIHSGQMLDILNDCLFGESTYYPIPGFRVTKYEHLGYIPRYRETLYNREFEHPMMKLWRTNIPELVRTGAAVYGGDGNLAGMQRYSGEN